MEENKCNKCGNSGKTPDGKVCSCVYKDMLEHFLYDLKDIQIPEEIKKLKFSDDFYKSDVYTKSTIKIGNKLYPTKSVLKLYLVHRFLRDVTTSYFIGTGKDIFDHYMTDGVDLQKKLQEVDVLILLIGNDFKNSYMQEILPSLLMSRKGQNIIVWDNKFVTESTKKIHLIKDKYGDQFHLVLANNTKKVVYENGELGVRDHVSK